MAFPGVKPVPCTVVDARSYSRRANQRKPFLVDPIPSIGNPYVTTEHILHRHFNPPEPSIDPPLPIKPRKAKKKKETPQEKKGGGLESEFIPYKPNTSYEFYDNPNELCDRLRLLIASRVAGNSNHSQEINSIIGELRESGYIM